MKSSSTYQIVLFFRFMRLFGISFFSILHSTPKNIRAIVAWEEDCQNGFPKAEDTQEVLWIIDTDTTIDDAIILGEYAYECTWISIDHIKIDESQIQQDLEWGSVRYSKAIQKLLQIRVKMIDDKKEVDCFFLHR